MNPRSARVLVAEDEENIAYLVAATLRLEGFETQTVTDGMAAVANVDTFRPDLLVLDVMLPGLDGFEVCRRLRAAGQTVPVIFLTARDSTADRVRGLTIGGDDYVTKPFAVEELVARVRVVLRRVGVSGLTDVLTYRDLSLDDVAHRVTRGDVEVNLSPTEYKLLRYLLVNVGRVVSKSQILDHVWACDFDGESTVVETYVSYLRRKIDSGGPRLIHTVRGVGYCLRAD